MLTRRLWFPIGIHFAWNFMQAGAFGGTRAASSLGVRSLLDAETSGPDLVSGGGSGLDGSVFAAGAVKPPFWRAKNLTS